MTHSNRLRSTAISSNRFVAVATVLLTLIALTCEARAQGNLPLNDLYFEFTRGPVTSDILFDIDDPLNRNLEIEMSNNLSTWNSLGTYKVTNTDAAVSHTPIFAGHPGVFYRIKYDSAKEILNTAKAVLNLPAIPFEYANILLPAHLLNTLEANTDNTPITNRITNAGATLGRVLFYDKRLSISNTISCASCHQQALGFTDGVRFSVGFQGGHTGRNSMGLAQSRFYSNGRFFWDERAPTLEAQTTGPVQDAVEMGSSFPTLNTELGSELYYRQLFASAFPSDPTINEANIQRALAQFVRSMVSYQSKFDQVQQGTATYTAQEQLGSNLFNNDTVPTRVDCSTCHRSGHKVLPNPRNIGLNLVYADPGVGGANGNSADVGKFKVGSLRNVELTGPYMHDGRFATLEQVVQHYSTGIQAHPNLDNTLKANGAPGGPPAGAPLRSNYTPTESAALVAFLKTLTDTNFTTDPRWSDPFNYSGVPGVTTPDFTATFPTSPALPLQSGITRITVGGVPAVIFSYDAATGVAELLFESSSVNPGSYPAVLTYSGGTTVNSLNQFVVDPPAPGPPNILMLMLADWAIDMSPVDNAVPPAARLPKMPNLQALAAGGLRFTRGYVAPLNSATHVSFMTGRHAFQTGVFQSTGPQRVLQGPELALPEAFTAAGSSYAKVAIGQWNLGNAGGTSEDMGWFNTGGWDEFYGVTAGSVSNYFSWAKNTNGTVANTTTYLTTDQVNEAIAFIGRKEAAYKSWFCRVAFTAGQSPFHDPPAGLAPPGGYSVNSTGNTNRYIRMLEALDTELGRLLATVPADTNIIMIADNGTSDTVVQAPFSSGHAKGSIYDGGTHVTWIVKGPAVTVPAGSTTNKLVKAVDLYATILELAEINPTSVPGIPATALAQSKSIVPILKGTDTANRVMITEGGTTANRGRAIITDGFPNYKLLIFNDPKIPVTPILRFFNIGTPANDINELSPLYQGGPTTTPGLTGVALNAWNACIAADAALGGGYLAP